MKECQKVFEISEDECRDWFANGFPPGTDADPAKDRRPGWENR